MGLFGFGLGLLTVNATEWVAHKYFLHGMGKKKDSFFGFHWKRHHNSCRKNDFYDADYENNPFKSSEARRETVLLFALTAGMSPWLAVSPSYFAGIATGALAYYKLHKKSHLEPEWAKKWLPWHYAHHMSKNQDENWCVTIPLFDVIMGTSNYDPNNLPSGRVSHH